MFYTLGEIVFLVATYVAACIAGVYVGARMTEAHIRRYYSPNEGGGTDDA